MTQFGAKGTWWKWRDTYRNSVSLNLLIWSLCHHSFQWMMPMNINAMKSRHRLASCLPSHVHHFSQNYTCTSKTFATSPPPNEKKCPKRKKIISLNHCESNNRIAFLSSSWLKVESKSSSVASIISSIIFCRLALGAALPLLDEAEETGGPSRFTGRQRDSSSARYCILMFPNMFPKTYPVKNPFFHMFPCME